MAKTLGAGATGRARRAGQRRAASDPPDLEELAAAVADALMAKNTARVALDAARENYDEAAAEYDAAVVAFNVAVAGQGS